MQLVFIVNSIMKICILFIFTDEINQILSDINHISSRKLHVMTVHESFKETMLHFEMRITL